MREQQAAGAGDDDDDDGVVKFAIDVEDGVTLVRLTVVRLLCREGDGGQREDRAGKQRRDGKGRRREARQDDAPQFKEPRARSQVVEAAHSIRSICGKYSVGQQHQATWKVRKVLGTPHHDRGWWLTSGCQDREVTMELNHAPSTWGCCRQAGGCEHGRTRLTELRSPGLSSTSCYSTSCY